MLQLGERMRFDERRARLDGERREGERREAITAKRAAPPSAAAAARGPPPPLHPPAPWYCNLCKLQQDARDRYCSLCGGSRAVVQAS
eukprot:gene33911-21020_t